MRLKRLYDQLSARFTGKDYGPKEAGSANPKNYPSSDKDDNRPKDGRQKHTIKDPKRVKLAVHEKPDGTGIPQLAPRSGQAVPDKKRHREYFNVVDKKTPKLM